MVMVASRLAAILKTNEQMTEGHGERRGVSPPWKPKTRRPYGSTLALQRICY
jgi:hypothetical protein